MAAGVSEAATFVVTNTNDSGPGSLRQAILDANSSPGADLIAFAIPGSGVHTISPQTELPALADDAGVLIDGYTQPGARANTMTLGDNAVLQVELSGASGLVPIGLRILSSSNTIQGLAISGFAPAEIFLQRTSGVVVRGCFIGTDTSGSRARAGGTAILIAPVDDALFPAVPPVIGGTLPGDRNLINGGVSVSRSFGGSILGNYIGTDSSGTRALDGSGAGVLLSGAFNYTIGGSVPEAGNLISGNDAGIDIVGGDLLIEGNRIGTDREGRLAVPNRIGILIGPNNPSSTQIRIRIRRNQISGNVLAGISVGGFGVEIQGNAIGTDASRLAPVENQGPGILVWSGGGDLIGGLNPGSGNLVAFNRGPGVAILATDTVQVSGNSIHGNEGLGIDLGSDGPTPNDPGDPDSGPNGLQNFPVLLSAASGSGGTSISGTVNSTPNGTFAVELFASPSCDPTGFGEGQTFLASTSVTTDGEGNGAFTVVVPSPIGLGQAITATATDSAGNTSEFSSCLRVTLATSNPIPLLDRRGIALLGTAIAIAAVLLLTRRR
jgi:titin